MAIIEQVRHLDVSPPIAGHPEDKNLLSMEQLDTADINDYIRQAYEAEVLINNPMRLGATVLPHAVLKAVMRQPSTRTAGSMTTAMSKLGGVGELISGMASSSEAKGESVADSWVAFATQADIIGARTAEEDGVRVAATAISRSLAHGGLRRAVPVINLGNGTGEHPTQTLGDLFTIHKEFDSFSELVIAIVGDHGKYRAHHSLMVGAKAVGMKVIAVESEASPVPEKLAAHMGDTLTRTPDLDEAMAEADVLYIGRNPDEYEGDSPDAKRLSLQLADDYRKWVVDYDRLQIMSRDSIVLHPRPRRDELLPSADVDPRMRDVQQMANMVPMRMSIIARHLGATIG